MDVFAGMIGHVALPIYSRTQLEGQKQLRRVHRHMTWALTHMIFLSATFALIATEEVVTIVLVPIVLRALVVVNGESERAFAALSF